MQRNKIAVFLLSLLIVFSGRLVGFISQHHENKGCFNSLNRSAKGRFTDESPFLSVDTTTLSGWWHTWLDYFKDNYWKGNTEKILKKHEAEKCQIMVTDTSWLPKTKSERISSKKIANAYKRI